MEDFIFGTLSTNESRIAHVSNTRGGITHAHQRSPRDPLPKQAVQIELTVGPSYPFDRAWVYWTNDGSDPDGANGTAVNGYATPLKPVDSEWDTFLWGYIRRFRGEIPDARHHSQNPSTPCRRMRSGTRATSMSVIPAAWCRLKARASGISGLIAATAKLSAGTSPAPGGGMLER